MFNLSALNDALQAFTWFCHTGAVCFCLVFVKTLVDLFRGNK